MVDHFANSLHLQLGDWGSCPSLGDQWDTSSFTKHSSPNMKNPPFKPWLGIRSIHIYTLLRARPVVFVSLEEGLTFLVLLLDGSQYPWRIRMYAILVVCHLPSTYPSYVSINLPLTYGSYGDTAVGPYMFLLIFSMCTFARRTWPGMKWSMHTAFLSWLLGQEPWMWSLNF